MGKKYSASNYMLAQAVLQKAARQIARFFIQYDVWLTPAVAQPPLPLGSFVPPANDPLETLRRAIAFTPFTPVANFTGQPAMSVPLFWNSSGLPIGAHFMARFGDEAVLFRLGAQLETERPWKDRLPPICSG